MCIVYIFCVDLHFYLSKYLNSKTSIFIFHVTLINIKFFSIHHLVAEPKDSLQFSVKFYSKCKFALQSLLKLELSILGISIDLML